jgi:ADP-L-glycero-D-manno-heptose 6-epimerase
MVTIVTGAAGFIGSNIVRELNARGVTSILAVDNLEKPGKFINLSRSTIADYMDKREFLQLVESGKLNYEVEAVLHQGACSDTMEHNGRYMMENNFRYTVSLFEYCQRHKIPMVYASSASVYGSGDRFVESAECEAPLNVYGYSKLAFDQFLRHRVNETGLSAPCVGLRYFNVYGPMEQHKERMASVVFHFFNQFQEKGKIRLFQGCDGYAHGEQRRDFISVEDIVKVNLWFLGHPEISGIFNLGTGQCRSFNDMAVATINAIRATRGEDEFTLEEMLNSELIEYIPFPDALKGKYQSYTEANMTSLREAGYDAPFLEIEEGVAHYVAEMAGSPIS